MELMISFGYVISAIFFVYGLKKLGSPATARQGNLISAVGMLTAVCFTLLDRDILSFQWILVGSWFYKKINQKKYIFLLYQLLPKNILES